MARHIEAGGTKVRRSDLPGIDPLYVVVDVQENGRAFETELQDDDPDLLDLVADIEFHGQTQPVSVRPIDGNRVKLDAGYRRWRALMIIRRKRVAAGEPIMLLNCVVTERSPFESFRTNICENLFRKDTTAICDAYNIRRLDIQFGQTDQEIAEIYRKDIGWVRDRKTLLRLPESMQRLIFSGALSAGKAIFIANSPEANWSQLLATAMGQRYETPQPAPVSPITIQATEALATTVPTKLVSLPAKNGTTASMRAVARELGQKNVGRMTTGELITMCETHDGPGSPPAVRYILDSLSSLIQGKVTVNDFLAVVAENSKRTENKETSAA